MTASTRQPARRIFVEHFQATFGSMNSRKFRRRALLTLGIAAVLTTGAASADWKVYDQRVDEVLKDIRDNYIGKKGGTVTDNLDEMNDRLAIKGDDVSTGEDSADDKKLVVPKEADDKLSETDPGKPTAAAKVGIDQRCPGGSGGGIGGAVGGAIGAATGQSIPAQQTIVCKDTYNTEIAMYRFSLEMYALAKTRNTKLHAIIDERNALDENDFGKMEENSNKLLALQTQMDNDRDRYQTYMQAYSARLTHLQKSSDLLSKQAIGGAEGGGGGIGSVIPGALGAGALAIALRTAAKTNRECTSEAAAAGACS